MTRKRCQDWTACNMGTYIYVNGNASHDRSCKNCSRGTYAGARNLEKCLICNANTFQNTTGHLIAPIALLVNLQNHQHDSTSKQLHDDILDCWYPPKILSLAPGNTTTKGRINTSMYGEHFGTPNSTIILTVVEQYGKRVL